MKIQDIPNKKNNLFIYAPKSTQLVNIRFDTNQKIQINKNIKKLYTIKELFNKFKVFPWKRKKIPLLFYNNTFISAIGLCTTQKKYNTDCEKISITWCSKNKKL